MGKAIGTYWDVYEWRYGHAWSVRTGGYSTKEEADKVAEELTKRLKRQFLVRELVKHGSW